MTERDIPKRPTDHKGRLPKKYGQMIYMCPNCRNAVVSTYRYCHQCGQKLDGYNSGKKPIDIRKWECPQCHTIHDRDINAAINILNEGRQLSI